MDISPARSPASRWIWIASIWTGFGLIDATQTVFVMRSEGMHHAWVRLFVLTAVPFLPWALATDIVMRLGRRFPPVTLRPLVTWFVHLASCTAIGLLFAAWATYMDAVLNPYGSTGDPGPFVHRWLEWFYNGIFSTIVLYGAILAVSSVLDSRSRLAYQQTETARLNEQLSKAQLDALRRQIEPHFLFNTLNAVAGLVREKKNDAAVSMIAGLSDFLRRLLEDTTRQQVPLGEEVEFAQKYLGIQKVRFVERLQFSVDVPTDLLLGPGSHPDSATPGGKRYEAWHRKTGPGRSYPHRGVSFRWPALRQRLQRRPSCEVGEHAFRDRNGKYENPPQEPLWRCVRPEHAQSGSGRSTSNRLCSV